jgi:putative ABC transport system permease protein
MVTVEVLEGARPVREAVLTAVSDDVLGFSATMDAAALARLLREGPSVNAIALKLDPSAADELWPRLAAVPLIEATSVKSVWLRLFEERVVGLIRVSALIIASFGVLIAVGVVYNIARVSLQERAWELASLRVLGFTRGEVSRILFAELATVIAAGVPLGLWLAGLIVRSLLAARSTESFDIPAVIETSTLMIAAAVVTAAGLSSAWVVRRRIDRLDLVAVLKTRD